MKITKSTLKSFIKKNQCFIKNNSTFDGMIDCVREIENSEFLPINQFDFNQDHTRGINGLRLVGQSRDYFREYNDGIYYGIEIYNSCGKSTIVKSIR